MLLMIRIEEYDLNLTKMMASFNAAFKVLGYDDVY